MWIAWLAASLLGTNEAGACGSVEEVEIPGARVAAKRLHTQLACHDRQKSQANTQLCLVVYTWYVGVERLY